MEIITVIPVLCLPKSCTNLQINCDSENVFFKMNMTTKDNKGNPIRVYSGLCNVKVTDDKVVTICKSDQSVNIPETTPANINLYVENDELIENTTTANENITLNSMDDESNDQNQVWIDPSRSPYVYNHSGNIGNHSGDIGNHSRNIDNHSGNIYNHSGNIDNHSGNIYYHSGNIGNHSGNIDNHSGNIYNHSGNIGNHSGTIDNAQQQETYSVSRESHTSVRVDQSKNYIAKNFYKEVIRYGYHNGSGTKKPKKQAEQDDDDDEFEVFLSRLPEDNSMEIGNEILNNANEDQNYNGIQTENDALKQLMTSTMESSPKQRKTILYSGDNAQCGQTIHQIMYNDPMVQCSDIEVDNEVVIEDAGPPKKQYQCGMCHGIFKQIAELHEHLSSHSRAKKTPKQKPDITFTCRRCNKNLKSKQKLKIHCSGHGDPNFECAICKKVFASKSSLRVHKKLHKRKYKHTHCTNSGENVRAHVFECENCSYQASRQEDLIRHQAMHKRNIQVFNAGSRKLDMGQKANCTITKVMSNEMFLAATSKRDTTSKMACDVCFKSFDRLSDLKKHLMEHVVPSTSS